MVPKQLFAPSPVFAAQANVTAEAYARAAADPLGFWAEQATRLQWETPWTQVLDWSGAPFARWFVGGRLNVAVNCVDRHVAAGRGDTVALHWEGEPGDTRTLTYSDLQHEVARAAHALQELGIVPGDRVVVYLPVIPETIVIALACARIGAVHSLVFGGFSAEALRFRVEDTRARLVVTTDGQYRRGQMVPVKSNADAAVAGLDHVEHVLVVKRTGSDVEWTPGRDVWWHDVVDRQPDHHQAQAFDAETPLFIIYTSGTTGRPKGLVHTMGGYLVHTSWTHWAVFDVKPDDVYWCTADLAWVTAHSYEIYGPLSNGVTQVIYEGTPAVPDRGRHFEIIQRYGVTIYYTAPTLVRTFMTWGEDLPGRYDLSSLRLLGSVGEAINPEAWRWFHRLLGGGRCPIVDTWWQSETGAAVVAPLPGVTPLKPGSATLPLPGLSARVVDGNGDDVAAGEAGSLVLDRPWPGMARGIWGDDERFVAAYWTKFARQGWYTAGDGARRDADGYIWITGRLDDVINISGHRLSSIEIESALVAHPAVAEAGVIGAPDPLTGQFVLAFVILRIRIDDEAALERQLREHVGRLIGPIARPRRVLVVEDLPKTRSGKIMRRVLQDAVSGRPLGDVTSVQDADVLEHVLAVAAGTDLGAADTADRGAGHREGELDNVH